MLVELSVVEQRYHAVMEVTPAAFPSSRSPSAMGCPARRCMPGASLPPEACRVGQSVASPASPSGAAGAEIEARCASAPDPSPLGHGLVTAIARKRRRQDYRRWERSGPMKLWRLDVMGSVLIKDPCGCGWGGGGQADLGDR